jgi:hypothetical protein
LLSIPIVVVMGVAPVLKRYGMIPIVENLVGKGLPAGTTLAFLMAVTALSLPDMIILKKVLKNKLIGAFVLIVMVFIIFTGYLSNIPL